MKYIHKCVIWKNDKEFNLAHVPEPKEFYEYLHNSFFVDAEEAMKDVTSELQVFSEKCTDIRTWFHHIKSSNRPVILVLPTFLADEKERATTRYVNITTIATFFSSVTATTLQMSTSIAQSSQLWNIVNFFWFISLVFSVSSGVSSLLGMTWRKSSMYVKCGGEPNTTDNFE